MEINLDAAVPAFTTPGLSSGEFVGMVADDPDNKIELKAFHSNFQNDHEALKKESNAYRVLPVVRSVNTSMVQKNYLQVKQDVEDMVNAQIEDMMNDPYLKAYLVKK